MFITLSAISIIGGIVLLKFMNYHRRIIILTVFSIFFLLIFSGFIPQIFGVGEANMQLNNFGKEYDAYYTHTSEAYSVKWLDKNNLTKSRMSVDRGSLAKILLFSYTNKESVNPYVIPLLIKKEDIVYLSFPNKELSFGHFLIKSLTIPYNFPTKFLNDNKNKIYNNGESEIFK